MLCLISIIIFEKPKLLLRTYMPLELKVAINNFLNHEDMQQQLITNNLENINKFESRISILENKINQNDIKNQISKNGFYKLTEYSSKIIDNKFEIKFWQLPFYNYNIFEKAVGYLEVHDEKYFITTGNGQFYYGNLNDLENNELILFPISHNFEKVIDFKNLKEIYKKNIPYSNAIAIKDTLIHDNHIYVSLVDEIKNNCFMTSILKANINDNFSLLNFEYFFKPDFCLLSKDNTALIISGGALSINPNKNELYLSVGDYRHWDKVNLKKKSILGKTLAFGLENKKYRIYTSGHRNALSIYYDENNQILLSSEMGPHYGDEINVLKENHNYGWPISSYGLHYSNYTHPHPLSKLTKYAPIYKSHSKYGFEEPLFSFSPFYKKIQINNEKLVGGPALKNILRNVFSNADNEYLVFGMKSKLIYNFKYNNEKSVMKLTSTLNLNYRIRDAIELKDSLLMIEEENPSLMIMREIIQ